MGALQPLNQGESYLLDEVDSVLGDIAALKIIALCTLGVAANLIEA